MKLLRVLSSKDLDEINSFLGELKDGDLYKKRLKALEDQKAEINAMIEVYGKANDIDRIRSNALRDEEQAKKILDKSLEDRTSASEEIKAAKAASERFVAKRNSAANENFSERERILKDGEADIDRREKAHARSLDDLADSERQVAADMETAVAIRTSYTEAVASLKTAITATAKAL